ncbi:type II toxin-antitoxin system death-on-curing family toxin [Candidatus Saccharibacteria bacterium]|nr:type II toxin-antitoxin system death-on-curing family toxin [Candidatus Saccharibacteria bacterium]
MIVLSLEHLLEIHALVLAETGGASGLRDLGRLESAVATQTQNVFGEELYANITDKSAAIIRGIIADHPFVDGNKRTAILAGLTLLRLNELEFRATAGEIENYAVEIATKHIDVKEISNWLNSHSIQS